MTVPTQNVKTDISRPMCAKHPERVLWPSRVRDGKRTGCWLCMAPRANVRRAQRYAEDTEYREAVLAQHKRTYLAHREARLAATARYRNANRKKINEQRRRFRAANRERLAAKNKEWQRSAAGKEWRRRYYATRCDVLLPRMRAWRQSPRGQIYQYARLQRERNLRELEWLASDLTARVPQFTHLG